MSEILEAHSVQIGGRCPCCGNLRLYMFDAKGNAFAMADLPRDAYVSIALDIINEGEITSEDVDRAHEHALSAVEPEGRA